MDPVSLAASIAGLIALGGSIITLSRKLYVQAKHLRSAKREISKFARDIELFGDIISLACCFLQEYSPKVSDSPVLQYLASRKVLQRLIKRTKDMYRDIKEISPHILLLKPSMGIITRWRWVRRKLEIKAMWPKMEGIKTNFTLVLLMVRLEPLYGQDTERSRQEM
jgi:hypothetical protein